MAGISLGGFMKEAWDQSTPVHACLATGLWLPRVEALAQFVRTAGASVDILKPPISSDWINWKNDGDEGTPQACVR